MNIIILFIFIILWIYFYDPDDKTNKSNRSVNYKSSKKNANKSKISYEENYEEEELEDDDYYFEDDD